MKGREHWYRSVSWRGDGLESTPYVAVPGADMARDPRSGMPRYTTTGTLHLELGEPPVIESIVVRDSWTEATVEFRGTIATLTAPVDKDGKYVAQLWGAARQMAGEVRRHTRPPGLTDIEDDEQVLEVVRMLRRQGRRPTLRNVATASGISSYSALRSYVALSGRTWKDIVGT